MSLRPGTRTEVRKKSYKIGVDADEARRRREDNLVEIRKNKREDNLLKKRREGLLLQSQQLPDAPAAIEKRVFLCHVVSKSFWSLLCLILDVIGWLFLELRKKFVFFAFFFWLFPSWVLWFYWLRWIKLSPLISPPFSLCVIIEIVLVCLEYFSNKQENGQILDFDYSVFLLIQRIMCGLARITVLL